MKLLHLRTTVESAYQKLRLLVVALPLWFLSIASAAQSLDLSLISPSDPNELVVVLGDDLQKCDADRHFEVVLVPAKPQAVAPVPIFGNIVSTRERLEFQPSYPLDYGSTYRAVVYCHVGSAMEPSWQREFSIPGRKLAREVPKVEISPSATDLPANTLRFYLSFSTDMRGRFNRRDVSLRDDGGVERSGAFMSFGQELWSADGRRLTLLLDPGRIKRGVSANEVDGAPLVPGRRYTLSVLDAESDTSRAVLISAGFRAIEAERRPLIPAGWSVSVPAADTRKPVSLIFDRVMDRALLDHAFKIETSAGEVIAGKIQIAVGERSVDFIPDHPWKAGEFAIIFDGSLEDVCGNRIGEALDHEIWDPPSIEVPRITFPIK